MHLGIDTKITEGIKYVVDFSGHGEVVIFVKNMKTGRTKMGFYETADYNYRDGYSEDDVLEIYRLVDELCEGLKDG